MIVFAPRTLPAVLRYYRLMRAIILGFCGPAGFKETLEFKNLFYHLRGDSVPYCPQWWEKERASIYSRRASGIWVCCSSADLCQRRRLPIV